MSRSDLDAYVPPVDAVDSAMRWDDDGGCQQAHGFDQLDWSLMLWPCTRCGQPMMLGHSYHWHAQDADGWQRKVPGVFCEPCTFGAHRLGR